MVKHTLEEVQATLKAIVRDNSDTFAKCFYSVEGYHKRNNDDFYSKTVPTASQPMCIVGHVVHTLDGVEGLRKLKEGYAVNLQCGVFDDELGYADDAIDFMQKVQFWQDNGENWEAALEKGTIDFEKERVNG